MNLQSILSVVYYISGIVLLLLGIIILKESPRGRVNRITAFMLFCAATGPLLGAFYQTALEPSSRLLPLWFYNLFFLWELFFPALVLFSMTFPVESPFRKKHPRMLYALFLPHILHLFLMVLFSEPDRILSLLDISAGAPVANVLLEYLTFLLKLVTILFGFALEVHEKFFSFTNLLYVLLAVTFLSRGYGRLPVPSLKRQVRVIILGVISAVGLYAVAVIIPTIFGLRLKPDLRYILIILALLVGPGSIAWAIVKHRFLDVRLIVRQSLVYSISSGIIIGGYLLILRQFGNLLADILGQKVPFLEVGFLVMALLFFQPIMNKVNDLITRLFVAGRGDYRNIMERFSREVITLLDFSELVETILNTFRRELQVETASVAVFTTESGSGKERMMRLHWRKESYTEVMEVESDQDLCGTLTEKGRPTFVEELPIEGNPSPLYRKLKELGSYLMVPLMEKGRLVGFLGLSKKVTGFRYVYEELTMLAILANQIVVAMNNARLYSESLEKERLEEELNLARQIQMDLLPRSDPKHPSFQIVGYTNPSRMVGGDYYDYLVPGDGRLCLAVGDVTGKGVPAALMMARVQAIMHTEAQSSKEVEKMVSNLNRLLLQSGAQNRYVTFFLGELDTETLSFKYCNAGHNYPILIREDGSILFLETGGLILGAFEEATYFSGQVDLKPNDLLVLYTDGITEALNPQEQEFGEKRLLETLSRLKHLHPEALKEQLISEVRSYVQGVPQYDDMTLMVLKVNQA
jgi:sigma-B regulation protein RsbU (phosphoserine phosphatase)